MYLHLLDDVVADADQTPESPGSPSNENFGNEYGLPSRFVNYKSLEKFVTVVRAQTAAAGIPSAA